MEDKPNGVQVTPSTEGKVQVEEREGKRGEDYKSKKNSPKVSKILWLTVRSEFEAGTYLSLKELAKKHGVAYQSLKDKIYRESWNERKATLQDQVLSRVDKGVLKLADKQSEYLLRLNNRSEKYEAMLDASVSQLATTNNGVPLCEPSDLDTLSRSEIRVMEMRKTALKIVNQVDLTSAGQGLGDSFVQAIQKLRSSPEKLEATDLGRVLEAEVE